MENEEIIRDILQPENASSADIDYQSERFIPVDSIVILLVDIWKITNHAKTECSGTKIISACERVEARIERLGFELTDNFVGKKYDSNRIMKVIEHDGGDENIVISECISPEIRYKNLVVREAEVITKGS